MTDPIDQDIKKLMDENSIKTTVISYVMDPRIRRRERTHRHGGDARWSSGSCGNTCSAPNFR